MLSTERRLLNELVWREFTHSTLWDRPELLESFVHNRARMVSASFLCKHLLIDYRRGALPNHG